MSYCTSIFSVSRGPCDSSLSLFPMATRIIVDDSSSQFTYGGGSWSGVAADYFFGDSATWPAFARDDNGDTGVYGSFTFTFQGMRPVFHIEITAKTARPQVRPWLSLGTHLLRGIRNGSWFQSMGVRRTRHHSWILLHLVLGNGTNLRPFLIQSITSLSHASPAPPSITPSSLLAKIHPCQEVY